MSVQRSQFLENFQRACREQPQRVFATFDGKSISFAEVQTSSACLAADFAARGLVPGSRVAVMMRNSFAGIAVIFALARAGITWVPINAQIKEEGIRLLLQAASPDLILLDTEFDALIDSAQGARAAPGIPALIVDADYLGGAVAVGNGAFDPEVNESDLFAIMFTSGTSGAPKGVLVTHRMMDIASNGAALVTGIGRGDVMFVWEPLFHIGGAQLLLLPFKHEVRLAFVSRFSASRFWHQVSEAGASHIHYLGGILQMLLKQPVGPHERTHGARVAWGAGCPVAEWVHIQDRFGLRIRECYGMTEASSVTTVNADGVVGSIGKPVPWFDVALLDPEGRVVGVGQRGEIVVMPLIEGAILGGYLDNTAATQSTLKAGRLHTGDIGSIDAAGNLFYHGRMTDSIRVSGENVSAWEVEHVAASHPAIEECAVIGVSGQFSEQDIKLFVKVKADHVLDAAELFEWLEPRLARFQTPRYIDFVNRFEKTPSERIVKRGLSHNTSGVWDRMSAMTSHRVSQLASTP